MERGGRPSRRAEPPRARPASGRAPAGRRQDTKLKEAARAFERDRFDDTRRILRPLVEQAPEAAAVRELLGLSYYRLGRWKDAIRELEAFARLTGSTEQHPVLADCYRALQRWRRVEELWEELRAASPSAELVAEGRIVAAGALADRGEMGRAISVLERSATVPSRPRLHHLRLAYALADLYERAGDVPRARDMFRRVLAVDAGFADVAERAGALG